MKDRLGYIAIIVCAIAIGVIINLRPIPVEDVSYGYEVSDDYIVESRRAEEYESVVCETVEESVPNETVHFAYEKELEVLPSIYPEEVFRLNEEDYLDLCRVLHGEANTECKAGQKAVVEVIGNRVLSKSFPNNVRSVISQKGQFDTWRSRSKYKPMQMQIDAIEEVRVATESELTQYIVKGKENGTINENVTNLDYVFFCTQKAYERIGHKYMGNIIKIGNHVFGTMK